MSAKDQIAGGSLAVDKPWLMLGNCLERMKEIPDGSVDLIVTDPPYTMTKRGRSCRPNWMPSSMGSNVFSGKIPTPSDWIEQCYRVLKPNGAHLYTFCNTNDIRTYLNSAENTGFRLHNIISMIKDTGMPSRWYLKQTELILFFRKGRAKPINDMTCRDWVKVTMPKKSTGKLHITQKPIGLISSIVTNSSDAGGIVLDPFMGSGTTGVACVNAERRFIGIEQHEPYFDIGRKRIAETIASTAQPAPLGGLFDAQAAE